MFALAYLACSLSHTSETPNEILCDRPEKDRISLAFNRDTRARLNSHGFAKLCGNHDLPFGADLYKCMLHILLLA